MFAFLVDSERRIFEQASDGGLSRGFFVWNSEVGAASFGIMTFLYRYVCGNHIVWGAQNVAEVRIRHIGSADERAFRELGAELIKYAEGSASEDEARIERARSFRLGTDKEAVLDAVFALRIGALSRTRIDQAYVSTVQHPEDGDPGTAWGIAQGLTRVSQTLPYADERSTLDRAAGKVLEVAF
jgi:hypothetical protein